MTVEWRRGTLKRNAAARLLRDESSWETGSVCIFTTYPRRVREALAALAERASAGMSLTEYEREYERILEGVGL